jgi:hypothetical protein
VVQGARFAPTGAVLVVGTDQVPITDVREVAPTSAPAAPTAPADDDPVVD